MSNYSLEPDRYTIGNALLWGNCIGHLKKVFAKDQSFAERFVHGLITLLEAIPIIGQIASLVERQFVQHTTRSKSINNATQIPSNTIPGVQLNVITDVKHAQNVLSENTVEIFTVPREVMGSEKALKTLASLIEEGAIIDRNYIVINYPKLKKKVGKEYEAEARKLINEAYLEQMKQRVENGELAIPASLLALLKYEKKEGLIQTHEAAVRSQISDLLESMSKEGLEDKEPLEFVNELRNILFDAIAKHVQLDEESLQKFKKDLIQLYQLELHLESVNRRAREFIHAQLIPQFVEIIDELPEKFDDLKPIVSQRIKEEIPKIPLTNLNDQLFGDVLNSNSDMPLEERVRSKIESLSFKEIRNKIQNESEEICKRVVQEIQDANDWKKKYKCEQIVEYSQGLGGDDEILGEGCCFAIHMKWGKALATSGTKKIKSIREIGQKDLVIDTEKVELLKKLFSNEELLEKGRRTKLKDSPNNNSENQFSSRSDITGSHYIHDDTKDNVSTADRILQAKYALERALVRRTDIQLTQSLLKKDEGFKAKEILVNTEMSIGDNLRALSNTKDEHNSFEQLGFLDLGIYLLDESGHAEGHAIGCKIDHPGGLYRFWDPNRGIFQSKNFDQFCEAFDAFMEENYKGWQLYTANEIFK